MLLVMLWFKPYNVRLHLYSLLCIHMFWVQLIFNVIVYRMVVSAPKMWITELCWLGSPVIRESHPPWWLSKSKWEAESWKRTANRPHIRCLLLWPLTRCPLNYGPKKSSRLTLQITSPISVATYTLSPPQPCMLETHQKPRFRINEVKTHSEEDCCREYTARCHTVAVMMQFRGTLQHWNELHCHLGTGTLVVDTPAQSSRSRALTWAWKPESAIWG